jgi:N-methylhydantoinase A
MTRTFEELEAEAASHLIDQGVAVEDIEFVRWMDGMYLGQTWDNPCQLPRKTYDDCDIADCAERFEAAYEKGWGTRLGMPIRVTTLRVAATGKRARPNLQRFPEGGPNPVPSAELERCPLIFRDGNGLRTFDSPIYDRDQLLAGNIISGPALIIQKTATTTLLPGDEARIDQFGNIRIRKVA